jgi:hypothetical protein
MNNILFKIIVYLVVILGLFFSGFFIKGCSNKPDFKESNSAQISGDSSREIIYTRTEFDEKIKQATDSLAKVNNIPKTKTIIKYLKQHLTASDSFNIANTFKPDNDFFIDTELSFDTTNYDVRFFNNESGCFIVSGVSMPDTTILSMDYNTDIETYFYWQWNKPTFLKRLITTKGGLSLFDFSKYNDAVSLSSCNGDTINISKNILIIKK